MDMKLEDIENEMRDLYPKKELAYMDYLDNTGDPETADRFINEFRKYRDRWNGLVKMRKKLINRE